jgi:hypothetical protein
VLTDGTLHIIVRGENHIHSGAGCRVFSIGEFKILNEDEVPICEGLAVFILLPSSLGWEIKMHAPT